MLVVNLFGAPSSGKSTLALLVGGILKTQYPTICTEVPDEIAKLIAYDDSTKALKCQLYVAGKQFWQIARCDGHADVVVCDSPLLLSAVYGRLHGQNVPEQFAWTLKHFHDQYESLNYFVLRDHEFETKARVHTEQEAEIIQDNI